MFALLPPPAEVKIFLKNSYSVNNNRKKTLNNRILIQKKPSLSKIAIHEQNDKAISHRQVEFTLLYNSLIISPSLEFNTTANKERFKTIFQATNLHFLEV